MQRHGWWLAFLLAACGVAHAQWEMESSGTTADLRGIDNVGGGVAWASGTNGTVLRTEDGGYLWQACAIPPGAEKLDFRGVQAFDANTAIVMSSGKGDLSRLYKTTDGCHTWKLVFTNPDKDGFWDAVVFKNQNANAEESAQDAGELVGDPVKGRFVVYDHMGPDWPTNWNRECACHPQTPKARKGETAFAASNSSVLSFRRGDYMLGTGGVNGSRVIFFHEQLAKGSRDELYFVQEARDVPIATGKESRGIFSMSMRNRQNIVAVGGDYLKPDDSAATAAWTDDGGKTWATATTPPHGYRSAVAYDAATKTWITVGPNGTDISTDDGKNWRAVHPDAAMHEAPDADRDWNALSLPFVVGPHGRIGKLNPKALATTH
jgi:photosystem II stability/assembly factor-like uncharacterized protein